MFENKYILGLDIGISSVGWGLLQLNDNDEPYRIIDVGSRIFPPGEVEKTGDSRAKERREKRGARRITRRREFRVDRIRYLLFKNGILHADISNNQQVSEVNETLTESFDNMINNYYKKNHTTPYKLKTEALDRKLNNDELSIILVHYAKKRGYKSNRESKTENDNGKVLSAIKENSDLMHQKKYRTISEMYIKDEKFAAKIKNSVGDYKVSVTREMYLNEINKVLDSQIKFGIINENFKQEYLEIWQSQRNYSKGPGGDSPYGGDLIEKMVGKCNFDGNPRAPKLAPSSEIFVSLTRLVNLRYKVNNNEYQKLTSEEISKIIEKAKEKNKLTYKDIANTLNQENIKFKDLQLTKKEYSNVLLDLKKELNFSKEEKIDINSLNDEYKEKYNSIYSKKLLSKVIIELKGYHQLRETITKCFDKETWNQEKENIEFLDELALFCTNYKLNEDIIDRINKSIIIDKKYADEKFVDELPNFKDHLMLSTEIIRELNPIMIKARRYDEAMIELGYNFSDLTSSKDKKDLLVPINRNNNITNQRVIRSMTQARKVINAVIKKYGRPKMINIETARELAKSRAERNEITKSQDENKIKNVERKKQLVELGFFPNIEQVNSTDLLKFKLWEEQKEMCAYSLEKITLEDIYVKNNVQIDHILPYSRTFNDNYLNKTLVLTKANQDKGNKTPYEWFGKTNHWEEFESYINSLNINQKKKDNYLLKNLDFDTEREMRTQNLNDTKYISKELASLIKTYLNVEKVNVYAGAITAKLRGKWGFNRLTHSYISDNYILPEKMKKEINKDRDNHLHHAMDALIIASITPSLEQKVSLYEMFDRYIENLTKEKISNGLIEEKNAEYINHETGEIISTNLKDYLKEQYNLNNIYFNKRNMARLEFPLPYEDFKEEAMIRVYEQNLETMKWKLESLRKYTKDELKKIHPITPSISKVKISGAMHAETYYGIKEINDKIYKTSRKSLNKIKLKDLKDYPDKEGGSKDIYNAIKEWLGTFDNGEDALKAHNGVYPTNPNDKENKPIKKIKVYEEYNNTGHMINKSNVDKGDIYRIDVLKSKKENDDKLYFAAYDIYDICKINALKSKKSQDSRFIVKLEFAQGKNNIITTYEDVLENYNLIQILNKNDLVKIILKDNRYAIGYIVGFTGGKLKIKSVLGDGYDLIGENKIFKNIISAYEITVTTIKTIEKLSISILGEIHGL